MGGLVSIVNSVLIVNSVFNVNAVVATFNQEKAQVGAFSMIVQVHRLIGFSTSIVTVCSASVHDGA